MNNRKELRVVRDIFCGHVCNRFDVVYHGFKGTGVAALESLDNFDDTQLFVLLHEDIGDMWNLTHKHECCFRDG